MFPKMAYIRSNNPPFVIKFILWDSYFLDYSLRTDYNLNKDYIFHIKIIGDSHNEVSKLRERVNKGSQFLYCKRKEIYKIDVCELRKPKRRRYALLCQLYDICADLPVGDKKGDCLK